MKNKLGYIVILTAFGIASCSAFYSISGLAKLFSGIATSIIVMASFLEIAKIVITTILHRYWDKLNKFLKTYLSIGVFILMIITSLGVYGLLSSGYQQNKNKFEIHNGELSILDNKKQIFQKNIVGNEKIIITKNKRIDQLTNLRLNQEARLDSAKSNRIKDKVRNDISLATQEIQKLSNDIDLLNNKNNVLSDSIGSYNIKSLELTSKSEISNEIGSLKYISDLTGAPMDSIVNYLILLIIVIFDPLAISLIIVANRIFELNDEEKTTIKDEDLLADIEGLDEADFNVVGNNKKHLKFKIPINKIKEENYFIPKEEDRIFKDYEPTITLEQLKEEPKVDLDPTESENEQTEIKEEENISDLLKSHPNLKPLEEETKSEEIVETTNDIVNNVEPIQIPEETIIEEKKEEIIQEQPIQEQPIQEEIKQESINKITIDDIKEKREEIRRGFSVNVPSPKHKTTRI